MIKKLTPEKVLKYHCPECGELQAKVYPWSNLAINPAIVIPVCKRCINKKAGKLRLTAPNVKLPF
jgi:hypothetical protein